MALETIKEILTDLGGEKTSDVTLKGGETGSVKPKAEENLENLQADDKSSKTAGGSPASKQQEAKEKELTDSLNSKGKEAGSAKVEADENLEDFDVEDEGGKAETAEETEDTTEQHEETTEASDNITTEDAEPYNDATAEIEENSKDKEQSAVSETTEDTTEQPDETAEASDDVAENPEEAESDNGVETDTEENSEDNEQSEEPENTEATETALESADYYEKDEDFEELEDYSDEDTANRSDDESIGNIESRRDNEEGQGVEESKEAEHYRKLLEIGREAFNNSGSEEIREGTNSYKELSQTEKEALSNKAKELIDSTPKGERGDFRVPEPEKIKGVNSEGRIIEAWKPDTDGAVEGSRHMETPQKGQVIDRIGAPNGHYFCPMGEDGKPVSLKERAIGDHLPEKNVSDNASYHAYEIQQDFTKENFRKAVENSDLPLDDQSDMLSELDTYYDDCANSASKYHHGDVYAKDGKTADGVKTGTIDHMFKEDDGGATQYITPFSADKLQQIGMIKEIKK